MNNICIDLTRSDDGSYFYIVFLPDDETSDFVCLGSGSADTIEQAMKNVSSVVERNMA